MQFSFDTSNETKSKVYEGINIRKYAAVSQKLIKRVLVENQNMSNSCHPCSDLSTEIDSPLSFNL